MSKNDLMLVLNGIIKVTKSGTSLRRSNLETILNNSSFKSAVENAPSKIKNIFPSNLENTLERASMVPVGVVQFASIAPKYIFPKNLEFRKDEQSVDYPNPLEEEILNIREEDLEQIYVKSLGVEILQQNEDGRIYEQSISSQKSPNFLQSSVVGAISPLKSFGENLGKDPQPEENIVRPPVTPLRSPVIKPLPKKKPTSHLGETSKQRKVPATRLSRLVSYGSLAAGLGIGALTEVTKRSLGLANPNESSLLNSSPFLTEANATRIVDTLCRVRGAALKIGQILSLQDNALINPQLQKVFERVRHAADFMPDWQMERMLVSELGIDWRSKIGEFDPKPFAAASIGQVHLGKLHDGRQVAIKIQYPGVGQGINSDIDNLMSVLNVWNIIPEGVFIDNIITVAKRELAWEVDYLREAECAKRFRKLLESNSDYYVPEVIDELTTKQVYTTELIEGISIDKCVDLDQETRDRICHLMLDLFFRELFEFQFMQTDPNWANFLYNPETKQIGLLDFGSSREYGNSFVRNYMHILEGAAEGDKEAILKYSREIGFLSGFESKAMENAHLESVLLLGEALRSKDAPYDFGAQDLTRRIQSLVPVMVKERLVPPPEEVYSLHRKLSGIFLLCARLKGRVNCYQIFQRVHKNYYANNKIDSD